MLKNNYSLSSCNYYLKSAVPPALILLLGFFVYLPIVGAGFNSDDFAHLAFSVDGLLPFSRFLEPVNEHIKPIFRAFFAAEFLLFGTEASHYYLINIALHLINTALLIALGSALLGSARIGLIAGLVFCLSASHWRVIIWVTTQGQLLASFFFLLSLLCFVKYCKGGSKPQLLLSAISHMAMLLSFTTGIEVPLLYFALAAILSEQDKSFRKKIAFSLISSLPFIFNLAIYLLLRKALLPEDDTPLLTLEALRQLPSELPQAAKNIAGGIYYGYLHSFSGAYLIPENKSPDYRLIYIRTISLCFAAALALGCRLSKKELAIALWLLVSAMLFYSLPAIPRLDFGYLWFATRARYRYLPCLLLATLLALLLSKTKLRKGRVITTGLSVFVLYVLLANAYELQQKIQHVKTPSRLFQTHIDNYLGDTRTLLSQKPTIDILDRPFGDKQTNYSAWNALPSMLAKIYLEGSEFRRINFLPDEHPAPLHQHPQKGSGLLLTASAAKHASNP